MGGEAIASPFNRYRSEARFSTKIATDIATRITIGLLEPVYAQIDPMRLGEIERFVRIAVDYGERLATDNVRDDTIENLVVGYPSHGFIIDRREAETLFRNVKAPCDELERLGNVVFLEAQKARVLSDESARPIMRFANEEARDAAEEPSRTKPRGGRRSSGSGATAAEREGIAIPDSTIEASVRTANGSQPNAESD